MTKRIIALLLALIMVFSLVACSENSEDADDEDVEVEEKEEDDDEEEEKEDEDNDGDVDIDISDEDEDKDEDENEAKDDEEDDEYNERYSKATFENGMAVDPIYDKNGIVITPKLYTRINDPEEDRIELVITNNSGATLDFNIKEIYLNHIRINGTGTTVQVASGQSGSIFATFDYRFISAFHLTQLKEINITFGYCNYVFIDTEYTIEADSILFEVPEDYSDEHYKGTQAIIDREGIYCAPIQLYIAYTGCYIFYLYLENENDFEISVGIDSASFNGQTVNPVNYGTYRMKADSKNAFTVELKSNLLPDNITETLEFELNCTVYNLEATNSAEGVLFKNANDGTFKIEPKTDSGNDADSGDDGDSNDKDEPETSTPDTNYSFVGSWEHKKTAEENFYFEMNLNADGTGDNGSSRSNLTWKNAGTNKIAITLKAATGGTTTTYAYMQADGTMLWDFEFEMSSYGKVESVVFTRK